MMDTSFERWSVVVALPVTLKELCKLAKFGGAIAITVAVVFVG
jgi:hypothetical protein